MPITPFSIAPTAEIIQPGAIPLSLWTVLFIVSLILLLLGIWHNRPDGDPETAVFISAIAFAFSAATTYLITIARDISYEIVPVVNNTTGTVIDHTVLPVVTQYEIPGLGWLSLLLIALSVLSFFSAYLAMVRTRRDPQQ